VELLCRTPRQKSLLHSSWSWSQPSLHLRNPQARGQREMFQPRPWIPAEWGNASKIVPLPAACVSVPKLGLPPGFVGPRGNSRTVLKFNRREDEARLWNARPPVIGPRLARTRWANPMRARGETERLISAGEGEADTRVSGLGGSFMSQAGYRILNSHSPRLPRTPRFDRVCRRLPCPSRPLRTSSRSF
jgi:hypothetical protein